MILLKGNSPDLPLGALLVDFVFSWWFVGLLILGMICAFAGILRKK